MRAEKHADHAIHQQMNQYVTTIA